MFLQKMCRKILTPNLHHLFCPLKHKNTEYGGNHMWPIGFLTHRNINRILVVAPPVPVNEDLWGSRLDYGSQINLQIAIGCSLCLKATQKTACISNISNLHTQNGKNHQRYQPIQNGKGPQHYDYYD